MRLAEKRCATFCTARIARGFVVLNPATAAAAVRSLTRRCEFHSFSSSARFFCNPVRASLSLALIIVLAVVFNSAYHRSRAEQSDRQPERAEGTT
jgi:hypothetical protein